MRYNPLAIDIPIGKREAYNNKIVAMIYSGNTHGITKEEIFNLYSGKGGLHGLSKNDFDNYYEYSEAKKAFETGQFFTPHQLCQQIIAALQPPPGFAVADLTCGMGNFFNCLPEGIKIYGNEIDDQAWSVCRFLYPEAEIKKGDFIYYNPEQKFDLVLGNPPFNLFTEQGISQYAYLQKSCDLLKYAGLLAVIVPASFLTDELQDKNKIAWVNEHFHFILTSLLSPESFDANIETKLLVFQKKGLPAEEKPFQLAVSIPFDPAFIYKNYIAPVYEQNKRDGSKLRLLTVQQSAIDKNTQYQITKKLWHIHSNLKLKPLFYAKAMARLELLKSQTKPPEMSDKEWDKTKLTPDKILRWLITILQHQNDKSHRKILKVVKTNYGLKQKAYHKSLQPQQWEKSVHDLLLSGEKFNPYKKLYDRKKKALDNQLQIFTDMERDPVIDQFLDDFTLTPKCEPGLLFPEIDTPVIQLKGMQKNDLGLCLQKKYSLLSWEQGGGKSIAGMAWLTFWKQHCKNFFLLAPALAINATWIERLKVYGFDFIVLESIADIYKIQKGQIVIVSYDRAVTLQRFIKKYIKMAAYKIGVLVDESDELTNAGSQRSRAALNCFRKGYCKLLTTGTTTRNNINELYTQLELLYNNSANFICRATHIYRTDPKTNIIHEVLNLRPGYPFPAFWGAALFKACFCPQKTTVFGIKKETQDVYNADLLKEIVAKTIITRKFEEIVGEKKYSIHTHAVTQSPAERDLYKILLVDFLQVCYHFYTSTGNARKEAALRLIRQIKVLIKATSIPHLMPHYTGQGKPAKYDKIQELTGTWANELVAIGTIFKTTARDYYAFMQSVFPARKIFYIDGEAPVTKRKKILEQFRSSHNGILICTQQSLKSSVNIPYCNKCIIESLQWNIPKISQFYFRFIRFDNTRHTQVHFVNYGDTIELNLLALLMAKEKLNDFIKTTNETSTAAIYSEFGIDLNILDMMIQKDYDGEGKLVLRWGKQQLQ